MIFFSGTRFSKLAQSLGVAGEVFGWSDELKYSPHLSISAVPQLTVALRTAFDKNVLILVDDSRKCTFFTL